MRLFRNREIRLLFVAMIIVTAVFTLQSHTVSAIAAAITFFACLLIIITVMVFLYWRYKQIALLSACLKRVNGGDYSLELQDNDEGELSILKSEIYKVTMTLKIQNESLKKDKTALADSLSDITHQLRTPLTSMFMMTDLLCGDNLPDERRAEFTGCIRTQLERLQWLVESLLKISKLDADAIKFKKQTVKPCKVIAKAAAPLNIPMELKNQKFFVDAPDFSFICDVNWTSEAFINIMKNCIEHTPEGGEIHITAATNPLYTQFTIADSGPGIDKADMPYIFNRFYKGKASGAGNVGIGLAMSKRIVEAQGGSIEAKNVPCGGASFVIRFPKQNQ